ARGGLHEEDRVAALNHSHAAIANGSDDATALAIAAHVIALDERDTTTAFKLFDRALELSSSNVFALSLSALALAWIGKAEPAIERAERAIRLSPFDSYNFRSHRALALAHFHTRQYEDAVHAARVAIDHNPNSGAARAILAAALLRLGRPAEAKAAARGVLQFESGFTISGVSRMAQVEPAGFRPLADAWREIGLPD